MRAAVAQGGPRQRRVRLEEHKPGNPPILQQDMDPSFPEEDGPMYDPIGAEQLKARLRAQGLNVPDQPIDVPPVEDDFDPEGWRSLLDLMVGYDDQGEPSMRGYEDWVNSQLRHGMDREQARREYDDIVRSLNPPEDAGWNLQPAKAQGDEGGNWLWGNDQSLLSYHPNLDPRTWVDQAMPGPEPGAVAGGAAAGGLSLLDLLPLIFA